MFLHTVEPKTAQQLVGRLTEVERILIRRATPDGLEHLRTAAFASDGPVTPEAMTEVKRILDEQFAEASSRTNWWHSQPWTN